MCGRGFTVVDFLGCLFIPKCHGYGLTSMEQGNVLRAAFCQHANFILLFSCLLWDENDITTMANQITQYFITHSTTPSNPFHPYPYPNLKDANSCHSRMGYCVSSLFLLWWKGSLVWEAVLRVTSRCLGFTHSRPP